MLTAYQLDQLIEPISSLYERYQTSVIEDIARRLANLDFASAAWQVQRLNESAALYEEILDELAILTGKSQHELRRLFEKAGVKAMRFDDSIYRAAGLDPLPLNMSPAMVQVLKVGLSRTDGLLYNLTASTVLSGQEAFKSAADLAYMQVSTGAMDYNSAIKSAIVDLADQGLHVARYPGRTDQIDVAMRRAVLTGVNQTAAELSIARMNELGVDLVQTSAHIGARPAHQIWQGKVFSRSGTHGKYPDFVAETGYGTVTGLCGVNCRHSFYPYYEGLSADHYQQAELEGYAKKTVTYKGEEIGVYEATQEQRGIERKIREWKRRKNALEAAGLDTEFETAKIREWQSRMRSFIGETGLQRQREREQIWA